MVQIDESVITKRKYHVGRVVREKWVLGIYDTTLNRGYVQYVENRNARTLETIIRRHVRPGTEIWTDMWRGYRGLTGLGYVHRTVNHSRYFRDPVTGVCTNRVEGLWAKLKGYLRRLDVLRSPFLPEYIDQFMWVGLFGDTAPQRLLNLSRHISERY